MFAERFLKIAPYRVEPITQENISRVQTLLESNPEYFHATQSHPVSRADCMADISALPPGKTMSDKSYLLLSDSIGDLAVIDFIEQYPNDRSGYLGFFILSGERHNQGIGQTLLGIVEKTAQQCGLSRIELACFASNKPGPSVLGKRGLSIDSYL